MKKLIALTLALLLVVVAVCAAEEADEAEGMTLREGKYIVGRDIEAGTYALTCVGTTGQQMNDAYGSLGNAYDAIDGSGNYGSLFGMLGDMMEELVDMTVEVLGDYGDVLESHTMKAGDTMRITLREETALQITDGSCTIVAVE